MPATPDSWLWWIFSVLIVGLILSVVGNLITPVVRKSGEGWLQKRRLKKQEYRRFLQDEIIVLHNKPMTVVMPRLQRTMFGLISVLFAIFALLMSRLDITRLARVLGDADTTTNPIGLIAAYLLEFAALIFFGRGFYLLWSESNHLADLYKIYDEIRKPGDEFLDIVKTVLAERATEDSQESDMLS